MRPSKVRETRRGHTRTARKIFGKPPKDCPKCGAVGGVVETRVKDMRIRRRRVCKRGHRWTTIEVMAKDHGKGVPVVAALEDDYRQRALRTLIAVLKEMARD